MKLSGDTGYFWFFNNANVEAVVKVLNGCGVNHRWWVFAGGLTDQQASITVTDTITGATKTYNNPAGTKFVPVQDTDAFASCSSSPACTYSLNTSSLSAGSGAGSASVNVITQPGCNWTAVSNSSFLTVTGGGSGSGNGTVTFNIAANASTASRIGTLTIAGHTFTVTQAGTTSGGSFEGTWNGTTSQGKPIQIDVFGNAITRVFFGFRATGGCTIEGDVNTTFNPPRTFSGNTFSITVSGLPSFTVSGTFNTSSSASGTLSFTYNQPFPPCTASGSATWTATR